MKNLLNKIKLIPGIAKVKIFGVVAAVSVTGGVVGYTLMKDNSPEVKDTDKIVYNIDDKNDNTESNESSITKPDDKENNNTEKSDNEIDSEDKNESNDIVNKDDTDNSDHKDNTNDTIDSNDKTNNENNNIDNNNKDNKDSNNNKDNSNNKDNNKNKDKDKNNKDKDKNNNDKDKDNKDKEKTKIKWANWSYFDNDSEIRFSIDGKNQEKRAHSLYEDIISTTFEIVDNEYHIKNDIHNCKTCDGKIIVKTKAAHILGEYTKKDDDYEHANCVDCGKELTREHSYLDDVDIIYINKDKEKHIKAETIYCETCDHKKVIKTEMAHKAGEYTKKDDEHEHTNCTDCGEELERSHSYGEVVTTYEQKDKDHHIKVETSECETCDYEKVEKTEIEHKAGEYTKKDDEHEHTNCTDCGEELERSHSYGDVVTTYKQKDKDHHIKVETSECETCDHEKVVEKEMTHKIGEYTKKDDEHEHANCTDCGEELERGHNISTTITEITYEKKDENTHYMVEHYACSTCDYEKIRKIAISHEFGNYESKDDEHEHAVCTVCEEEKTREHSYLNDVTITYRKKDNDKHIKVETTECSTCDHEKVVEKEMAHTAGEYTKKDGEHEHTNCTVCGEELERSHSYGDVVTTYEQKDKDHHIKVETSECSTCDHEKVERTEESHIEGAYTKKDDEYEHTNCTACEEELERSHSYGDTVTTYEQKDKNKHIKVETTECDTCTYIKVVETEEAHTEGEYVKQDEEHEVTNCVNCEEELTRGHTYDEYATNTTYEEIDEDRHKKIEEYNCETCTHINIVETEEGHHTSEYTIDDDGNKVYPCTDGCGYEKVEEPHVHEFIEDPEKHWYNGSSNNSGIELDNDSYCYYKVATCDDEDCDETETHYTYHNWILDDTLIDLGIYNYICDDCHAFAKDPDTLFNNGVGLTNIGTYSLRNQTNAANFNSMLNNYYGTASTTNSNKVKVLSR